MGDLSKILRIAPMYVKKYEQLSEWVTRMNGVPANGLREIVFERTVKGSYAVTVVVPGWSYSSSTKIISNQISNEFSRIAKEIGIEVEQALYAGGYIPRSGFFVTAHVERRDRISRK